MRTELFWILSFCGFAAVSIACGLLAWPQLASVWPGIQEQIDRFHRLHPLAKLMLLVFIAGFIAYGSTKTNQVDQTSGTNIVEIVEGGETNAPPMMLMTAMPFTGDEPPIVTSEDAARGYQLVEVRTNAAVDYTMPEDAVLATNWWVRGACEDVKRLDFNVWRFPFGSNEYDSAWAFAWGKLRFELADTNEIVAVGALMSAVPYRSRLWAAADTNGSRFVTWESFFLNRDTNTPVNAQVELSEDGDFVTRSNGVEKVFHRIDPDDWDGDGWRNDDDPDPYVWEEYWDSFWQELPDGANESAYCWIEIRPRWHSYIEFVGDGSSDLDDPYLWAKAGETYRVQLLIGKTYAIVSSQPLDVVGQSSPSIEIDGDGTSEINVVWPLRISTLEGNGRSFRMSVRPSWLGGVFVWTDSCCTIYGDDLIFRYGCEGNCGCSGCYSAGYYVYEGYSVTVAGGWCGCSPNYDDDDDDRAPVGVTVSFSDSAILFEDEYQDSYGSVVPWRSTGTELTCTINGGDYGGYVQIDISGDENLIQYTGQSLTYTRTVSPHEQIEFTNRYKATAESGESEDIVVTASFVENETGWTGFSEAKATAVRIWTFTESDWTPYRQRKELGVGEEVRIVHFPDDVKLTMDNCVHGLYDWRYVAPSSAGTQTVTVRSGGSQFPLQFSTVEPAELKATIFGSTSNTVAGVAGGFDTTFYVYVLPTNVSFSAIRVMEEGCTTTNATGCFTWPELSGLLTHSGHGADNWHGMNKLNVFYDTVSMTHMASWGTGGSFTWPIPNLWKAGDDGDPHYFPHSPSYDQRVEVDADGTSRIMKFTYTIEQMTNLQFRVTGGRQ